MSSASYVAQRTLGDWRRWREIGNVSSGREEISSLILDLSPGLQNLSVESIQTAISNTANGRTVSLPGEGQAQEVISSLLGNLTSLREDLRSGVDSQLTELGNLADGLNSASRQLLSTVSNAEEELGPRVVNRAVEDLTNGRAELLGVIGRMVGNSTGEVSNLIGTIEQLVEQDSAVGSLSAISNIVSGYLATGPNQFSDVLTRVSSIFEQYTAGGEIGQLLLQQAPDLLSGVINSFGLDFGVAGPLIESGLSTVMDLIGGKLSSIQELSSIIPAQIQDIFEQVTEASDPTAVIQTLTSFSPRDTEGTPLQPFAGKLDKAVQIGGKTLKESYSTDGNLSSEKGKPPHGVSSPIPETYIHGALPNARVTSFGKDSSTVVDDTNSQVDPIGVKLTENVESSLKAYPAGALSSPEKYNGPVLDQSSAIKVPRATVNRGSNFTVFTPQIRRRQSK